MRKAWAFKIIVLPLCFALTALLPIQSSFAARNYGIERIRSCQSDGSVEDFQFLEFGSKEMEFNLGNPFCAAYAFEIYGGVKAFIATMNGVCKSGSPIPRAVPSPFEDLYDIAKAGRAAVGNSSCLAAISSASLATATALGQFAIILGTAESYYKSVSVCGDNWHKPNPKTYLNDGNGRKKEVNDLIAKWIAEKSTDKLSMTSDDPTYREWVYGGVEFESDRCLDPTREENGKYPKQRYYFRGLEPANYRCEAYNPLYCRSGKKADCKAAYECCLETSENYICLSKNSMKIAGNDDHIFCKAGSTCDMDRINNAADPLGIVPDSAGIAKFEAYFRDNNRIICAKSYSFCPYNFSVGGGTTFAEYFKDGIYENNAFKQYVPPNIASKDMYSPLVSPKQEQKPTCDTSKTEIRDASCNYNNKAGRIANYCQFYRHCTVATERPYVREFSDFNPYFSRACLDFKGDAKNGLDFNGTPQLGKMMNFSAPLAQCFKETLENVFFNRYGHSLCADGSIAPDDKCTTGLQYSADKIDNYMKVGNGEFKKGNPVESESFFSKLQNNMRFLVKMVLTFSVSFFGFNILMGKVNFQKGFENRKEILVYLLKFALVVYFALGDAWQSRFFDGVYGASTKLAELVFKVRVDDNSNKRDGCQFGSVYKQDGSKIDTIHQYPSGKEYLMIWDTLDCKIMKFLGYGPSTSAASVAVLIIASFFTGGIGLYFALSILIFAMLFIALTIRAIQLFISIGIAIIVYVFISPLIIPLVLFERTKNIFEAWLTQLIGFCFQPIILFAYLGIFITLTESAMVGTARYNTDSTSFNKQINCERYCGKSDGTEMTCRKGQTPNINPYDGSMSCILHFSDFGKSPGFELFGIGLAVANTLFENIEVRLLLVLKCSLLIFILARFMDEIPGITSQLISSALPSSDASSRGMLEKTTNLVRGVQKRLGRAVQAQAEKGSNRLANAAKGTDRGIQANAESGGNISAETRSESVGNMAADSDGESSGNMAADSGGESSGDIATNSNEKE